MALTHPLKPGLFFRQDVTDAKVARAASFSPAAQAASTQITIQNSPARRSTRKYLFYILHTAVYSFSLINDSSLRELTRAVWARVMYSYSKT